MHPASRLAVAMAAGPLPVLLLCLGCPDGARKTPSPPPPPATALAAGASEETPAPVSIIAVPPTIESIISWNFRKEGESPWLATFRPKPETLERVLPGVSKDLLRVLLDAGMDRLTVGARRFGPGPTRAGRMDAVRILEAADGLSGFLAGLTGLVAEGGAEEVPIPSGRLFRVGSMWIGVGKETICVISTKEYLARSALKRIEGSSAEESPGPILGDLSAGAPWDAPMLVLRRYDPENPGDRLSPLNPPVDDTPPQTRPIRVTGIRVRVHGEASPTAELDVLTPDPDKAKMYFHELLGLGERMEEPAPPGPGWLRLRLIADKGEEAIFRGRLLRLFGYQFH